MDPELYERLGHTWWDENQFLNFLETALNPPRFAYMQRNLASLATPAAGLRVLDVGCGGGLLSELFAKAGYSVTGVDPASLSIETATRHAAESGLIIDYRIGTGEQLPLDDSKFDVVCCCDVLEHVDDVDQVIAEISRVLRPGGLFFFDTINRTRRSKLLAIKVFQEWRWFRWADPGLHDWEKFITPEELARSLERSGLEQQDRVGLAPRSLLRMLRALRLRAKGRLTVGEMGARVELVEGRDESVLYLGFAKKSG